MIVCYKIVSFFVFIYEDYKELCALRGFFGPPICSYLLIRTITKVYKSQITLTFTIAMVTKLAAKIG